LWKAGASRLLISPAIAGQARQPRVRRSKAARYKAKLFRSLREGHAFHDAINHGHVDLVDLTEFALPLRAFARCEMSQTRLAPQNFALCRYFEPLRH